MNLLSPFFAPFGDMSQLSLKLRLTPLRRGMSENNNEIKKVLSSRSLRKKVFKTDNQFIQEKGNWRPIE